MRLGHFTLARAGLADRLIDDTQLFSDPLILIEENKLIEICPHIAIHPPGLGPGIQGSPKTNQIRPTRGTPIPTPKEQPVPVKILGRIEYIQHDPSCHTPGRSFYQDFEQNTSKKLYIFDIKAIQPGTRELPRNRQT